MSQIELGILGYGNLGDLFGAHLRRCGLESIVAYNRPAADGRPSDLVVRRAAASGVALASSLEEFAGRCRYVVSTVTGVQAVAAAQGLAPYLTPRHLYLDATSAAPRVKHEVAAVLEGRVGAFADGAVESSKFWYVLLSGPAAASFSDALSPWQVNCKVVGTQLGDAARIKLLRSIMMKGINALLIECGVVSARYGLQDEVFGSVFDTMEKRGFVETVRWLLTTGAVTGERRAQEMEMSAELIREAGVDPVMTRATIERLYEVANLGVKEHFGGEPPADYATALAAIDDALKSKTEKN